MGRTRTGCLTCRSRKLKCSEERPVCAQCTKANRECIPSSGITFRHQQNPSMNGKELGAGSLKSFYGYKETFGKGTVWVDIPQELTFVHTTNPYEDDTGRGNIPTADMTGVGMGASQGQDTSDGIDSALASGLASLAENATRFGENRRGGGIEYDLMSAAYPQHYATHGLEALSAVASQDHYNYATHPASMDQHDNPLPQHSPSNAPIQDNQLGPHNNLEYALNQSARNNMPTNITSGESNIDPALHTDQVVGDSEVQPQLSEQQSPAQELPQVTLS